MILTRRYRFSYTSTLMSRAENGGQCSVCLRVLPASAFYHRVTGRCRECHKLKVRENRKTKLAYYLKYDRQRSNDPKRVALRQTYAASAHGREILKVNRKAWQQRNQKKRRAHVIVGNYVRDGKLAKQPCETCGSTTVQAHHDDYDKPLEVRWFCRPCHMAHHRLHGGGFKPRIPI